jgi:hypothetical protein
LHSCSSFFTSYIHCSKLFCHGFSLMNALHFNQIKPFYYSKRRILNRKISHSDTTFVGIFTRMVSQVYKKGRPLIKCFPTVSTHLWILFSMTSLVSINGELQLRNLSHYIYRILTCVNSLSNKVMALAKEFPTVTASVCYVMSPLIPNKMSHLAVGYFTFIMSIQLNSRMNVFMFG